MSEETRDTTLGYLIREVVQMQVDVVMEKTKDIFRDEPIVMKIIHDWGMAKMELAVYSELRNYAGKKAEQVAAECLKREKFGPRKRN
jgi:hypothetical protein